MTRRYRSPLRAARATETRERILTAFAEQLAEAKDEFSISKVAERAGVSPRTVYLHFPNREAQIAALAAWIDERAVGSDPGPRDAADLPGFAARMADAFARNEGLLRAQLAAGIARTVRARRKRARLAAIERAVAEVAPSPEAGRRATALIQAIIDGDFAVACKENYGLGGAAFTEAGSWLVRIITEALSRGDGPDRRVVDLGQ